MGVLVEMHYIYYDRLGMKNETRNNESYLENGRIKFLLMRDY